MVFDDINKKIQTYLKTHVVQSDKLVNKNYKLPLSDALFCARDEVRNQLFFKAIEAAIQKLKEKKQTITVVDAGSGVGLLGAYALALGADKCFFLEHNPHSLDYSRGLLEELGYNDQSYFIECDATECQLPKKYDLLISETITSGFVEEDFLTIVRHLKSFANEGAIIIPEKFDITMIEKDERGVQLNQNTIQLDVYSQIDDSFKESLNSQSPNVTYKTKAYLFDSIAVESGQCMSFLNERTVVNSIRN